MHASISLTKNIQADGEQSRQAVYVRCCLFMMPQGVIATAPHQAALPPELPAGSFLIRSVKFLKKGDSPMLDFTGQRIGFVVTGSFCTFSAAFEQAKKLRAAGALLTPVFSEHAAEINTRFGKADVRMRELEEICGAPAICTISGAEPFGPKDLLDLLVVAPCTANTAAKLAHGITDTTATMAVKSMLRRQKPIVLAIATNDALRASAKNIGLLMNTKHFYFVPLRQDAPKEKPASLVADFDQLCETVDLARKETQIQPIFIQ